MTDHKIKIEIPDCLSKPIEEGITPVTKCIGNTFSVAWELAFGGLDTKLEKIKYKRYKNIESFKQELDSKINKVPIENIVEAEMHIIGPTLESSKYYFEKEDLRNMFTSLIASSIDKTKSNLIHPSFVEIIKQLSTFDAQTLIDLKIGVNEFNGLRGFPIVNYTLENSSGGCNIAYQHIPLNLAKQTCLDEILASNTCKSLINLERLGIIHISYKTCLHQDIFNYSIFNHTVYSKAISSYIKKSPQNDSYIIIQKGMLKFTQFGIDFVKTCL